MQLTLNALPHRLFHSVPATRSLIAEASDLGFRAGRLPFSRLYDDACDMGIAIAGKHSTAVFFLVGEDKDREGEIAGWLFEPTPETLRACPGLAGWHVTIIND